MTTTIPTNSSHDSKSSSLSYLPEVMSQVGGWFTVEEGLAFHQGAQNLAGRGVIVEIGSWQGKSTICLAKGSSEGPKVPVYAIDPHVGSAEHHQGGKPVWTFDIFKDNIRRFGVEQGVVPIVKMSWDAAQDFNQPIEFLFIDGAHDYDSVKKDIQDWFPKLVDGGTVAFHDSCWPGVMKALGEEIYGSPRILTIRQVLGTTLATKVAQNTVWDRLWQRIQWSFFYYGEEFRRIRKAFKKRLLRRS